MLCSDRIGWDRTGWDGGEGKRGVREGRGGKEKRGEGRERGVYSDVGRLVGR